MASISTDWEPGNRIGTPRTQSALVKTPKSLFVMMERSVNFPSGSKGNGTATVATLDLFRKRAITPSPLRATRAKPSHAAGDGCSQLPSGKKLSLIFVVLRRCLNHEIFSWYHC